MMAAVKAFTCDKSKDSRKTLSFLDSFVGTVKGFQEGVAQMGSSKTFFPGCLLTNGNVISTVQGNVCFICVCPTSHRRVEIF